jgi:hypothetical protein
MLRLQNTTGVDEKMTPKTRFDCRPRKFSGAFLFPCAAMIYRKADALLHSRMAFNVALSHALPKQSHGT